MSNEQSHIVPLKVYVGTFLSLLVLTAATTAVAYVDLGEWNTVVALVIAVMKMLLVVLFFMHAWYNKGLVRVVMVASVLWLAIMVTFTLADTFTRSWTPATSSQGWGPSISLFDPR